ncbi:MAG: hypothetical protein HY744_13060 [Deltaproteobacteria bacterium]|nr:hypothetical protein [Deltaproteobacteria bacterium]
MRALGWLVVLALACAGASCQLILGEHEIYGEDRACGDDEDCHAGERCAENGKVCRLRCKVDGDCPENDKGWRSCADGKTCTEPIGTPCDPGNYNCGGYEVECLGEDSNDDPVLGYCTVSCGERPSSSSGCSYSTCDCPKGYVCYKSACRCVAGKCPY